MRSRSAFNPQPMRALEGGKGVCGFISIECRNKSAMMLFYCDCGFRRVNVSRTHKGQRILQSDDALLLIKAPIFSTISIDDPELFLKTFLPTLGGIEAWLHRSGAPGLSCLTRVGLSNLHQCERSGNENARVE